MDFGKAIYIYITRYQYNHIIVPKMNNYVKIYLVKVMRNRN